MREVQHDLEDKPISNGPTYMSDRNRVIKGTIKVALVIDTVAQG
jgi:hypothetical protein